MALTKHTPTYCNIVSWNVRGIMSSASSLSYLLYKLDIDIAILCEHKLKPEHKLFFDSIDSKYTSISACDSSNSQSARCGKAGVAIMYKKECQFKVKALNINPCERIIGIQITSENISVPIFVFAIYMPPVNYSFEDYLECIGILQAMYDAYSQRGRVILFGDFNVDINHNLTNQATLQRNNTLGNFLEARNLMVYKPSGIPYTFRPTKKTLDYVILPTELAHLVESCMIFDDDVCTVSDHLPIYTRLKIPVVRYHEQHKTHIAWNKCTTESLNNYKLTLENKLTQIDLQTAKHDIRTKTQIDDFANFIINAMHNAASKTLTISKFNKHTKPYWTEEVKQAHKFQREKRIEWIRDGRPRGNEHNTYKVYKEAKKNFQICQTAAIINVDNKFFTELDTAADCDFRLFWQLINSRRKAAKSPVADIIHPISNETINDPESINTIFRDHYASLFTPPESEFDNQFEREVDININSYLNSNYVQDNPELSKPFTIHELEIIVQKMKKRKAPSVDNIVNEHIMYGGECILDYLQVLFNKMIEYEYSPSIFDVGVIVPILKPGKSKQIPSNYRPITLLSVIYKMFEGIIKERLAQWYKQNGSTFPNSQQNGYQENLGSITASFDLQETILHNREHGSDTYAAFLDARSAFDRVWHNGLFHKLITTGIKGKLLVTIINIYRKMRSCVLVNSIRSDSFPVLQGVRQGGVLSGWFYITFIDELLTELQSSCYGSTVGSIKCGNPTLADDLTLLAPNHSSLNKLLRIVFAYSVKWKFEYNPSKCKTMLFSNKSKHAKIVDPVFMGKSKLEQAVEVKHVGIELTPSLKCTSTIEQRCEKGRASLFSILAIDKYKTGVNPLVLASLVRKISFSTLLYGSELWHNMTKSDYNKIEALQRMSAKLIQQFPKRTRTDMALSMLGWTTLQADIDKRKLYLFQKLCTAPTNLHCRKLFNLRLHLFLARGCRDQYGFIPDVYNLLHKYELQNYLQSYLSNATLPLKTQWKSVAGKAVKRYQYTEWPTG